MHAPWALPINRGFTEHAGYFQGCGSYATHVAACCGAPGNASDFSRFVCGSTGPPKDYRGYDWFDGSSADFSANGTSSSELIAARAERFVAAAAAAGEPFFLFLPFQNIHAPYDAAWSSVQLFADQADLSDAERVMWAYIYELDSAVGRVLAALTAAGVLDDSVIVLVSDNGAPPADGVRGRNFPLSGFKAETFEGGTRVPALVHAPGRLAPGRRLDIMAHVTDWSPTLVALAGGTISPAESLDGHDLWPALTGAAPGPRSEVIVNINPLCGGGQFGSPKAAIRIGDMKLLCFCFSVKGIANANETRCEPDPQAPGAWPRLHNLTADIGETTNLAAQLPDVVAQLEARLVELAGASVEPQQWVPPYQGATYYCADCPLHPATGPNAAWASWIADDR
jgi:arylsulfatase A-like enzyme